MSTYLYVAQYSYYSVVSVTNIIILAFRTEELLQYSYDMVYVLYG